MSNADNLDEGITSLKASDDKTPSNREDILSPSLKQGDESPDAGSNNMISNPPNPGMSNEGLDPYLLATFEQTPQHQLFASSGIDIETPHQMHSELISVPELLGLPILISKQQSMFQRKKNSSGDVDEFGGSESEIASRLMSRPLADSNILEEELNNQLNMKGNIPPPLPILPKQIPDFEAPKCPIDHISFIVLKKFQSFASQPPDMMGNEFEKSKNKKRRAEVDPDLEYTQSQQPLMPGAVSLPTVISPQKQNGGATTQPATVIEVEEIPMFVNNIVFCRDHKMLNKLEESNKNMASPGYFNLRHLIQHENYLDIKNLIKNTTMAMEIEKNESLRMKRKPAKVGAAGALKIGLDTEALIHKLEEGTADKTLLFESRFESGNLFLAQKVNDNEYNLLMQNDINTQGHTQWFYFRVQNTKKGHQVKFNIVNYSKPDSLFNYGMKVALYSEKKAEEKSVAWHRGCSNINYFANNIRKEPIYMNKTYYTLTFTYEFEFSDDTVYFAYSVPYTYTDLVDDLTALDIDPIRSQYVSRKTLCKTLAGNNCDYLTITSREKKDNVAQRKCVIISARVHPGETVGSWMMRGVIKFITDPANIEARLLRENFIFKIIPMLNPDGVINGNYRCSLAGCDLNRRWKNPSKVIHPTVYHTKKLIKESHEERGVYLFCDLHGHSRKNNIFMYGCHNQKVPEETRIFPYLLSKISSYFCYDSSRFGNQKSKESTARISLYKDLKNVPNIFTMESTFSGMDYGPQKGVHLSTDDLENMGRDLCRAVLVYSEIYFPKDLSTVHQILQNNQPKQITDLDKKKFKEDQLALDSTSGVLKPLIADELRGNSVLMKNCGDSSSGSESAPSDDNLQPEEIIKIIPVIDKKTKKDLEQKKLKQQQIQQQMIQEKEKQKQLLLQQQQALTAKKTIKKTVSRQNLQDKRKNERSMVKFPIIDFDLRKMDDKDAKKKPKPVMIDAWTQTDRSDYAIIKSRLQNQLLVNLGQKEPGLYQQLMQNQTSAQKTHSVEPTSNNQTSSNPHTLRFKSSKPHQLGSLTRTPGGYTSTPGGQISMIGNESSASKPQTDFANFLAQQKQHSGLESLSPTKHQYNSQLSNFANSDVTTNNIRSPSHKNSNNASSLVQYALGARELTNRTNINSNFHPMPDINQSNAQYLFKTPGTHGGALASIIEQNKFASGNGSSQQSSGGLQYQTPNIKRQLITNQQYVSSGQTSFKSNKNDISGLSSLPQSSQSAQGAPVVHSISVEQNNIKKLISNVQHNFKNNLNTLPSGSGMMQDMMQSPGRTPMIGQNLPGQNYSMNSNHQRNIIKSPQGLVGGATSQSAVPGPLSAQKTGSHQPQQQDLIFPVLKSKYQSVNTGNLSETVTGGGSSFIVRADNNTVTLSGAAISQALSHMESSVSNKFAAGASTKRGLNPSPGPKGGSNTKRNSSQQRILPSQIANNQLPSSQQSKGGNGKDHQNSRRNSQLRGAGAL